MDAPKESKENPICPHCKHQLENLNLHKWPSSKFLGLEISGTVGAYSYPKCNAILGLANVFTGSK